MKHWWLMRVKRFCFFFQTNWKRRTCSLACPSGAAIFAVCFSFFKANYVDQLFLEFIYQVLDRRRRRQLRPLTGSLDREIWNNGNFVLFVTFLANFICAADRWQRHPDVPVGCFFFVLGDLICVRVSILFRFEWILRSIWIFPPLSLDFSFFLRHVEVLFDFSPTTPSPRRKWNLALGINLFPLHFK